MPRFTVPRKALCDGGALAVTRGRACPLARPGSPWPRWPSCSAGSITAMAEHKVGGTVVLVGTIVQIEGDVAVVRVDRALADRGTVVVRLGTLPAAPYDAIHSDERAEMLRRHGVERCAICGVVLRSHDGGDHPWTPSDEDRIRDAMAEAQARPGRIVTR